MTRIVCEFSCGAASAVAAKLTLSEAGPNDDVVVINAYIREEREDNRRFLADCEEWLGVPITVLQDEQFGTSTHEVWRRKRYMKGPHGAPCSRALKRRVLDSHAQVGDELVVGYTAEEEKRYRRLLAANAEQRQFRVPLIERGLTKADCLAMVERAGIRVPEMYRLGFRNANCIGCPKGGEGYWNKIRVVFPGVYQETTAIQEDIGPGAYFFRNRKTGERFGLKDLDPEAGRHADLDFSCSMFCMAAEHEIAT